MINFLGNFNVKPNLPKKLQDLESIANNIYWSWNHDAKDLFRRIDNVIWEESNHNPLVLLGKVNQQRLIELSEDYGFLSHLSRVKAQFDVYLRETGWYSKKYGETDKPYIAYFSAEYGLTEALQIYSGGLGVLSGDHLKSSSDLGIPLVGVGLSYKEGYFQQYLSADGWQQERYSITDFYNQPMKLVKDENNEIVKVELDFPDRKVYVQAWEITVGRIPLYLLDTNVLENSKEDRNITRTLYGGNNETRIQQEIVLGIGGIRILHKIGVNPLVCHMNEGHSAFLALERILQLIENEGLSYEEAKNIGFYSNIFTTHTPVPAGIDVFPNDLVEKYFGKYYREKLKISDKKFYRLGTIIKDREPSNFNMAHLAMNMAAFVNGVSKLHGDVSKKMWVSGFKNIPFDEIPIEYVTNGVHIYSHQSPEMFELLSRYLGDKFIQQPENPETWEKIDEIPDEELWRTHERRRERLVAFARKRLRKQILERGGSKAEVEAAKEVLNASALTIGFARRFATYKRANLIFRELKKLIDIFENEDMPIQLIVAGKAHPKDDEGKKLIQEIISYAKQEQFRKKIVFLENYDMNIARYMVSGCDIWLNNPRRPLEASGTSGMKVIANGGLNFSVLDGWWDEAYDRDLGWKIGSGEEYEDLEYQDDVENHTLIETLAHEIIPIFYNRGSDKLPRRWIEMIKSSMKKLTPFFNTNRMLQQYTEMFYITSRDRRELLLKDDWKLGKEFTSWKEKLNTSWKDIKFVTVEKITDSEVKVGENFVIKTEVYLNGLTEDDVDVQIYFGKNDNRNNVYSNKHSSMTCKGKQDKNYVYEGEIYCEDTGEFGFTLRIVPKHKLLFNYFELGLIRWASE